MSSDDWYTPSTFIEAARRVMGSIDLDPASCAYANETVKAKRFFTIEDNGLNQEWTGNVWLNPPYSAICREFVYKLLDEPVEQSVLLIGSYVDTQYAQKALATCDAACFVRGRISFYSDVNVATRNRWSSMIIYHGANVDKFIEEFSPFGVVMRRCVE